MTNKNISSTTRSIWSTASLLRSHFNSHQYSRIILPFTLLRRLDCLLAPSKAEVLAEIGKSDALELSEAAREELLLRTTKNLSFFNISPLDLSKMEMEGIRAKMESYIDSFSFDVRDIFEHFNFHDTIVSLDDANLLFIIVEKFSSINMGPESISDKETSLVFEALTHRFVAGINESIGEHLTPEDIVQLTTSLVFIEDKDELKKSGISRTVYDSAAGMGGFLSSSLQYISGINPEANLSVFGQEIDSESYAICKANMLIGGQNTNQIKIGNTLSNDQFSAEKFDYMLSHAPFGMGWNSLKSFVDDEHLVDGFTGRFGAGLPRTSDSSLLFVMHLISKMNNNSGFNRGSRIAIILNGSPMFSGGASSGESEIRRHILEEDLLEAIVSLPTEIFYNTGISSYIWILSTKKKKTRHAKVQLIDGSNLYHKMRKSSGSKRNFISTVDIETITHAFLEMEDYEKTDKTRGYESRLFNSYEFGYRQIAIEHPLRLSVQITDEAIQSLRFAPKPLNAVMLIIYETLGSGTWTDETYGDLSDHEKDVRGIINATFPEIKEKQIKSVLNRKLWLSQLALMKKAEHLQTKVGNALGGISQQSDDFNQFELTLKATNIKLDREEKNQLLDAITWKNPEAERAIQKTVTGKAQPLFGTFEYKGDVSHYAGKVVKYKRDSDLRDIENIPLNPNTSTSDLIRNFFKQEVQPFAPDSWVDAEKLDKKDGEIGVIGYEINFSKSFDTKKNRDAIFSGQNHKLKNLIKTDDKGEFYLNLSSGKITECSTLETSKNTRFETRFDLNQNILNQQYYNIYLDQEEGKDWLARYSSPASHRRSISFNTWKNARIMLPPLKTQLDLVTFFEECEDIQTKMKLLKNSAFIDFNSSLEQVRPYQDVNNRYEFEFTSLLPTPLAILWLLAESKFNDRERCDAFVKFYEYLGYYLTSIVFCLQKPKQKVFYNKKRKGLVGLTMAFGYQELRNHHNASTSVGTGLNIIHSPEITDLLEKATYLRNDIAHRGLPSAQSVAAATRTVNQLNDLFQIKLRDFFEETTLVKPLQAKFDGVAYEYEVELLKGLGINPCKTTVIKTSVPMITNELYLMDGEITASEDIPVYKLFPLMIMEETVESSEIMGFYFYSDPQENELRYVCPYPNTETYKFKPTELIMGILDD